MFDNIYMCDINRSRKFLTKSIVAQASAYGEFSKQFTGGNPMNSPPKNTAYQAGTFNTISSSSWPATASPVVAFTN